MLYKNNLPNPSLSDFKSIYPENKSNRNIYKVWRWLFIGRISLLISWISARLNLHPNLISSNWIPLISLRKIKRKRIY